MACGLKGEAVLSRGQQVGMSCPGACLTEDTTLLGSKPGDKLPCLWSGDPPWGAGGMRSALRALM